MQPIKVSDANEPEASRVPPNPAPVPEEKSVQPIPSVQTDRDQFVRTVFRTVCIQVAVAVACIVLINTDHYGAAEVVASVLLLSFILFCCVYLAILFLPNIRRQQPWEIVMLIALAVLLSILAAIESTITRSIATPYINLVIWALLCGGNLIYISILKQCKKLQLIRQTQRG